MKQNLKIIEEIKGIWKETDETIKKLRKTIEKKLMAMNLEELKESRWDFKLELSEVQMKLHDAEQTE